MSFSALSQRLREGFLPRIGIADNRAAAATQVSNVATRALSLAGTRLPRLLGAASSDNGAIELYRKYFPNYPEVELSDKGALDICSKYSEAREILLNNLLERLPEQEKQVVERLFKNNDSRSFVRDLLMRAEGARRNENEKLKAVLEESACGFFRLFRVFGYLEGNEGASREALSTELESEVKELLVKEDLKIVPDDFEYVHEDQLSGIVGKAVTLRTTPADVYIYKTRLKTIINDLYEKGTFGDTQRFFLPRGEIYEDQNKTPLDFPFSVGIRVQRDGVTVVCTSMHENTLSYSNGLLEVEAFEVFIPNKPYEEVTKSPAVERVCLCIKGANEPLKDEFMGVERVARSRIKEKKGLDRPPLFYSDTQVVYTKHYGVDRLKDEITLKDGALTVQNLLEVFSDLTSQLQFLEDANLVFGLKEKLPVRFRLDRQGRAHGFLDSTKKLYSPSVGHQGIPNDGCAMIENGILNHDLNRYRLVDLIATGFSFPKKNCMELKDEKEFAKNWECSLCNGLQGEISSELFVEISRIMTLAEQEQRDFADDLLDFAIQESETLSEKEFSTISTCAHRVAAAKILTRLILKTLRADNEYRRIFSSLEEGFSIQDVSRSMKESGYPPPSLDDIRDALKDVARRLQTVGARPVYPDREVTMQDTIDIVDQIGIKRSKDVMASRLQSSLKEAFESPNWRYHKEIRVPKKGDGIPSYWVHKEKEGVALHFILDFLGSGTFKKVKNSPKFVLLKDKEQKVQRAEDVLYRSPSDMMQATLSGIEAHRKILEIPGAKDFFVPLPEMRTRRIGASGWKIEFSAPKCFGDLFNQARKLPPSDLIRGVLGVVGGLKLIHSQGTVHGDLKRDNVLLKEVEGEVRGYLTDFDHTMDEFFLRAVEGGVAFHLSTLRRDKGYCSPETDIYGLNKMMGELFLPPFFCSLDTYSRKTLDRYYKAIRENPKDSKSRTLEPYIGGFFRVTPAEWQDRFHSLINAMKNSQDPFPIIVENQETSWDFLFSERQLDVKKALEGLVLYAKQLEDAGSIAEAASIQTLVFKVLVFDSVFDLYRQTLQADRASVELVDEIPRQKSNRIDSIIEQVSELTGSQTPEGISWDQVIEAITSLETGLNVNNQDLKDAVENLKKTKEKLSDPNNPCQIRKLYNKLQTVTEKVEELREALIASAPMEALKIAEFPSLDQFNSVLSHCKVVAQIVESKFKEPIPEPESPTYPPPGVEEPDGPAPEIVQGAALPEGIVEPSKTPPSLH